MAERCDYYSDDEYEQALEMEYYEHMRAQEEQRLYDEYEYLRSQLEMIASELGIDYCISYLQNMSIDEK